MGTHLAEAGFVAAAVTNNPGNNALEPYTFWWERATGISEVLTAMLADSQFVGLIDPSRVGAAGFHSVGSLENFGC